MSQYMQAAAAAAAAVSVRDGNFVVLEPGSFQFRYGRSEYLYLPTKAGTRVARSASSENGLIVGGGDLDSALANNVALLDGPVWPIKSGRVDDWDAFELLLKFLVVKELGVRRQLNDSATLVCVPLAWSPVDVERLVQIMFETLNVPGLFVAEAPQMALFGCGLVTGIVIDIGHETTDIAAVLDSVVAKTSAQTLPLGGKHVQAHLRSLLEKDPVFMKSLGPTLKLDDQLVRALAESGTCRLFNVKERTMPPLLNTIKRAEWEYHGVKLSIGAARYQAFEILFQPHLAKLHCTGLAEAAYLVAQGATDSPPTRFTLWDTVLLTGGVSVVPGLQERLEHELGVFLAASETSGEFQAREAKFAKIPEYFSAYKEGGADATYLGGTIVARLSLNTSSMHITKADYNELGPSAYRVKSIK